LALKEEEPVNCWWWSSPIYGFQITFPLHLPLQHKAF